MKVAVFSDCHFEFLRDGGKSFIESFSKADVAIVAGDLCTIFRLEHSLRALSEKFEHVLFVAGNHDFYGGSPEKLQRVRDDCSKKLPRVKWLDDEVCTIEGRRFVGSTLWFPDLLNGAPKFALNDFRQIEEFDPWVFKKHEASLEFLEKELCQGDVLITHHFPFSQSIAHEFANSNLNVFFYAGKQAESLVLEKKPSLAIHGHTHESFDYWIEDIRVVCNPHGYMGENPNFDWDKVVDL